MENDMIEKDENETMTQSENLTESSLEESSSKRINLKWIFVIVALIIVCGVLVAIYFVFQANNASAKIDIDSIYSVSTRLDNRDEGFLATTYDEPTKYIILDSFSDYEDYYNSIDERVEDLIQEKTIEIDEYINNLSDNDSVLEVHDRMEYRTYLIDDYREITEKRANIIKEGFEKGQYDESFFNDNSLVIVEHSIFGAVLHEFELKNIEMKKNILDITFNEESGGVVGGGDSLVYYIPVFDTVKNKIDSVKININLIDTSVPGVDYKPIIYLYPIEPTDISVKLQNDKMLITSYPKYDNGWRVFAEPNGDLVDNDTGRSLYSLYYESNNIVDFKVEKDGYIVEGKDVAKFLEDKLSVLGLTAKEAEEFIIYWLPKLENNRYNYIRFALLDEINKNMPLEISPRPDSTIRVMMTFKALSEPIDVIPQDLSTPSRAGFSVVEWGGTEIK